MKTLLAGMLLSWVALSACARPHKSQLQWYSEYGRFHDCVVLEARESRYSFERGYGIGTCYSCKGEPGETCFPGHPVGPPGPVRMNGDIRD